MGWHIVRGWGTGEHWVVTDCGIVRMLVKGRCVVRDQDAGQGLGYRPGSGYKWGESAWACVLGSTHF